MRTKSPATQMPPKPSGAIDDTIPYGEPALKRVEGARVAASHAAKPCRSTPSTRQKHPPANTVPDATSRLLTSQSGVGAHGSALPLSSEIAPRYGACTPPSFRKVPPTYRTSPSSASVPTRPSAAGTVSSTAPEVASTAIRFVRGDGNSPPTNSVLPRFASARTRPYASGEPNGALEMYL